MTWLLLNLFHLVYDYVVSLYLLIFTYFKAKISKIDWVLRECLTRVSGDCDAARELFLFGLNITNIWDVMDEDRALVIKPIQSPTKREAACLKAVDVSK